MLLTLHIYNTQNLTRKDVSIRTIPAPSRNRKIWPHGKHPAERERVWSHLVQPIIPSRFEIVPEAQSTSSSYCFGCAQKLLAIDSIISWYPSGTGPSVRIASVSWGTSVLMSRKLDSNRSRWKSEIRFTYGLFLWRSKWAFKACRVAGGSRFSTGNVVVNEPWNHHNRQQILW
jgi:hypothetical protein